MRMAAEHKEKTSLPYTCALMDSSLSVQSDPTIRDQCCDTC